MLRTEAIQEERQKWGVFRQVYSGQGVPNLGPDSRVRLAPPLRGASRALQGAKWQPWPPPSRHSHAPCPPR